MSLALGAYRAATALLEPAAALILRKRARQGKEDPARLGERFGRAGQARPAGPLVWLHGVSVGETVSLLPLVSRLRAERPDITVLMTSGTVTSAELLARRLPPGVIHQFIPVDGPRAVSRFLQNWKPDVGIFVESELWPNLLIQSRSRGVRLALVSARLTADTARGWARRPAAARALLSAFDLILPQEAETAARLVALGARPGPELNLKLAGDPLPHDPDELARLRDEAGARPVILAASTHAGEETMVAAACPAERGLLVIAPRHPDRSAEVETLLKDAGRRVAVRSRGERPDAGTDVYLADTLGEMGLFMRLSDLVVLCGSLRPDIGGHNALEPARLGCAIVSGPFVHKNAALFDDLARAGAVRMTGPEDLGDEIQTLLEDPAARRALGENALAFARAQGAAFEAGWAALEALLPR